MDGIRNCDVRPSLYNKIHFKLFYTLHNLFKMIFILTYLLMRFHERTRVSVQSPFGSIQVSLQEQGGLLRQEEFLVWSGRKKSERRVFLFEDMILFSKAKHCPMGMDAYMYKSSVKVKIISLKFIYFNYIFC